MMVVCLLVFSVISANAHQLFYCNMNHDICLELFGLIQLISYTGYK